MPSSGLTKNKDGSLFGIDASKDKFYNFAFALLG
jgi:hypothetical protein